MSGYDSGMRSGMTLLLFSSVVFAQTSPAGKWISMLEFFDEPNACSLNSLEPDWLANSAMIRSRAPFRMARSKVQ